MWMSISEVNEGYLWLSHLADHEITARHLTFSKHFWGLPVYEYMNPNKRLGQKDSSAI